MKKPIALLPVTKEMIGYKGVCMTSYQTQHPVPKEHFYRFLLLIRQIYGNPTNGIQADQYSCPLRLVLCWFWNVSSSDIQNEELFFDLSFLYIFHFRYILLHALSIDYYQQHPPLRYGRCAACCQAEEHRHVVSKNTIASYLAYASTNVVVPGELSYKCFP
ncbi:hypothetical protein M514_02657 [Trichuris suis]|uniref:Uncharacterized protein n=1 Tax=Trichuris suis TaxID=68888 RepID=A0A085MH57_9BILA|nr:hypothetical protein M513_02657 [Trichuris suis]KFD71082.1 hypothetical protein M514_02657 [Trichuris suis]